jgi:hypothetical protein
MVKKALILMVSLLVWNLAFVQAQADDDGIVVPGSGLAEKLIWLQRSADSHNTYIVVVSADENIAPHIFEYRGAVDITIVIRGDDTNRTIRLKTNDSMFYVRANVTLVLDNNITLQGHRRESGTMVGVQDGGMFIMNEGSSIIGNIATGSNLYGTGVWVGTRGNFVMNGGTISGNTVSGGGGGVYAAGIFTMNGGIISENTASRGGGVYIESGGTFNMINGTISGNTASNGGGVYRSDGGKFALQGGTITGNAAREYGGGVYILPGYSGGTFTKTNGTITGYNTDNNNGNVVKDDDGALARRGHAVYVDENRRRETTAEPDIGMNSGTEGAPGGWAN